MSNQLNDKLSQYDVLYIEKVKYFLEQPINRLYRELVKCKREYYEPNQRIVFVDSVPMIDTKPFYTYLDKILKHLDIDKCFVHVVHNGNETVENPTNFDIPETMCVNPWIMLEIRQQGNLAPCCRYYVDDYPNVNNESVKEINFTDLRQQFLDGKKPIGCNNCWKNEEHNVRSQRQNDAYVYRDKIFDIDYNDTKSNNLVGLDIKINKTCNLSCRSCGPAWSSKWAKEVAQHKESYPQFSSVSLIKNEWTDVNGSKVWKDLEEITADLSHLNFSGGEPLLDKTHSTLLQYFINKQTSRNISLHYNTNATTFASNLIPLWSRFKEVELSFSIDAIGPKFEYVRNGVSWKTIVDTIEKYKKVTDTVINLNVWSTISTLNILDTYSVFQFCKKYELPVSFNPLNKPKQMNICLFNKKQKKYITDKLLNIQDDEFQKIIEPIVSLMNSTIISTDTANMINFLSTTDKIRKQDYKQTFEELANIL